MAFRLFPAGRRMTMGETLQNLTFSTLVLFSGVFLLYRNQGRRWYGKKPVSAYIRDSWEFQFCLDGECDFVVREGQKSRIERVKGPALVLSGPRCEHGWSGRPDDQCHNLVFHFDEADFAIRSLVGNAGYRKLHFRPSEIPRLQRWYDRCTEARKAPGIVPSDARLRAGFLEPLIYRIVASELTIFFLRHVPKSELGISPNYGESKVNEAMAWYEANLERGPNIADVARAIHLSPTHLRRLFHQVRGRSPQAAFTEVQFERAKWLMRDPEMTLEQIGGSAGFGSGSAFSRAFKIRFGESPRIYREHLKKNRFQSSRRRRVAPAAAPTASQSPNEATLRNKVDFPGGFRD